METDPTIENLQDELNKVSLLVTRLTEERAELGQTLDDVIEERDALLVTATRQRSSLLTARDFLDFMYPGQLPIDEPKSRLIELANRLHAVLYGDDPGTEYGSGGSVDPAPDLRCSLCVCSDTIDETRYEPWVLELICCGHSDGFEYFQTFTEADRFRYDYLDAKGHDRQAILKLTANGAEEVRQTVVQERVAEYGE